MSKKFNKIEIYTKPGCPACVAVKDAVENRFANLFETVEISTIGEDISVKQLTERLRFQPRAVPQVMIDDQYIGGSTKTIEFLSRVLQKENSTT